MRQVPRSDPASIMFLFCLILTQSARASWVDPDTPEYYRSTRSMYSADNREYELVFSDEFEVEGRTFKDGDDPRWTAIHKNDYTNAALHFYSHDNAKTTNGFLNISTIQKVNEYRAFNEKTKKFYSDKKYIQSAMLQGWNKFCFTGGIIEFSAQLPGKHNVGGLWPALWMLGNLARATYVGSSDYIWPYSYNECDEERRNSQEISACDKVHHYGMLPYSGRGAPEIDVIEAMQGDNQKLPSTNVTRPYQSCSLQVAPGLERNRPILGLQPKKGHWYEGMEYSDSNDTRSELNPFFYGVTLEHKQKSFTYQADALSANLGLNKSYYSRPQTYRVEWEPPEEDGTGGYIKWFTNGNFIYGIHGENLNITGSEIPSEAMYMIMNTAVASSWGFPAPCPEGCDCDCFECGDSKCECAIPEGYCNNFPASFEIDYVRLYQAKDEPKHILGCSPEKKPTKLFIEGHAKRYMEDDDKRPLEPVTSGGAPCSKSLDCGGKSRGRCSDRGFCVCENTYTGPSCLAHAGYYKAESVSQTNKQFGWASIYLPKSFIALVILISIGFVYGVRATIQRGQKGRKRGYRYQKLGAAADGGSKVATAASYQNAAASDYALPPQQKVVTYCVIDGRLVDQ